MQVNEIVIFPIVTPALNRRATAHPRSVKYKRARQEANPYQLAQSRWAVIFSAIVRASGTVYLSVASTPTAAN